MATTNEHSTNSQPITNICLLIFSEFTLRAEDELKTNDLAEVAKVAEVLPFLTKLTKQIF